MQNKRIGLSKKLRFSIFERDKFICQYCGKSPDTHDVTLQVDHVVSVKDGGDNEVGNLVTSCFDCNSGKGAKTVIKYKQTPEDIKAQLEMARERLEQVRAMIDAKNKIKNIEKEIVAHKVKEFEDLIGEDYNNVLIEKLIALEPTLTSEEARHFREAVLITHTRHQNQEFEDIPSWMKYMRGVLRNLILPEDVRRILMNYKNFFREHYDTVLTSGTRKMILDYADFGEEFHREVLLLATQIMADDSRKDFAVRSAAQKYTGKKVFTVYKSGLHLNYLVCDCIAHIEENLTPFE